MADGYAGTVARAPASAGYAGSVAEPPKKLSAARGARGSTGRGGLHAAEGLTGTPTPTPGGLFADSVQRSAGRLASDFATGFPSQKSDPAGYAAAHVQPAALFGGNPGGERAAAIDRATGSDLVDLPLSVVRGGIRSATGMSDEDANIAIASVGALAPVAGGLSRDVAAIRPGARALPPQMTPAKSLLREGVSLTPGQRIGGVALAMEDRAMSAPILGDAIRGARIRGRESLNRAVANRALAPVGETLPANVRPGHDMVAHVEDRLGEAYSRAEGMVSNVTPDTAFAQAMANIRKSLRGQPPSVIKQFESIVADRVTARMEAGPLDGAAIADIKSQLGEIAADNIAGGGADRTLGRHLSRVGDEITALAGRTNPEYLAAKNAADAGWANFVRLRRAAAASGTESGVFTPSQLRAAARAEDSTVGKGGTARGSALMGDLADNAATVMNQKIPDSGTAGRSAHLGLGYLVGTNPVVGVPVAAGLGAAAVPYMLMGRRLANAALRSDTSPEVLAASAKRLQALAAKEPRLLPLAQKVAKRLNDTAPWLVNPVAGYATAGAAADHPD